MNTTNGKKKKCYVVIIFIIFERITRPKYKHQNKMDSMLIPG